MPGITVYVPDGLKERMDAIAETNWSSIAQQAFEHEVEFQSPLYEAKTMDDVVERLRQSRHRFIEESDESGKYYGRDWAMQSAEYAQLKRLADYMEKWRVPPTASTLVDTINGPEDTASLDWQEFWEIVGVVEDGIITDEFVDYFCRSAKSVYDEVALKL